jgi:hypothetical protein
MHDDGSLGRNMQQRRNKYWEKKLYLPVWILINSFESLLAADLENLSWSKKLRQEIFEGKFLGTH